MSGKKCLASLNREHLRGKRVLVSVDFDVRLDNKGKIGDDSKIRDALPTIQYLLRHGASVILASQFGRFVGYYPLYRMEQFVPRLSELLGTEVKTAKVELLFTKLVGELMSNEPKYAVKERTPKVLLLENLKFCEGEMSNDPKLATKLGLLADLFVNDALSFSHRGYASNVGAVKSLKPAVAGLLMQKELECLTRVIRAPKRPLVAIVGGSRPSMKLKLIESLLGKVDKLLLGGGIIFTFYLAQDKKRIGSSLVNRFHDTLEMSPEVKIAKSLLQIAEETGKELLLPIDVVIGDKFGAKAKTKVVSATNIPDDWMGLDIGPKTIESFSNALDSTQTIIWHGPMGVYEYDKFAKGTEAIAKKLAELTTGKGVETIIVGGDTGAVVEKLGLVDKMSHVSKGHEASLELLAGKELPAVAVLDDDGPRIGCD